MKLIQSSTYPPTTSASSAGGSQSRKGGKRHGEAQSCSQSVSHKPGKTQDLSSASFFLSLDLSLPPIVSCLTPTRTILLEPTCNSLMLLLRLRHSCQQQSKQQQHMPPISSPLLSSLVRESLGRWMGLCAFFFFHARRVSA